MGDKDIFYPIKGYEDYYEINKLGNIRSLDRVVKRVNNSTHILPSRIIKLNKNGNGYFSVNLYKNYIQKNHSLHRLLAINFIPNPNNYPVINHIDGNPLNNELSNLEWCTQSHNVKDGYNRGRVSYKRKLKKEEVLDIFLNTITSKNGVAGGNVSSMSKKYKIGESSIRQIVNRKAYKEITNQLF